ncbi:MAG: hypothetical protein HYX26_01630 [Acidobacteriales bacterium]|nr:hypothetical protein [Terriglobales bacterium]
MQPLQLSHFSAALLFAFFASVVFGITQKQAKDEMIRYAGKCFLFFAGGTLLAAWLMAGLRWLALR